MTFTVHGACASGYGRLADLLAERLETGREVGASIGVYRDGQPVVEIWGGHADRNRRRPWTGTTVTPLASTTKALATAAVLLLVDRGHLDLDRPIADYWPTFATAGKGEITTALVLVTAPVSPLWTPRSAMTTLPRSTRSCGPSKVSGRPGHPGPGTAITR